jgi:hypothetical protein
MQAKTTPEEIEHLRECAKGFDAHPPPDPPEDFGAKLKAAVRRRVTSRSRHSADPDNDSFGAKLKRAVDARLGSRRANAPRQPSSYLRRQAARSY